MKKQIFTLVLLCMSISLLSQQVARDRVVMEIGTGTWCGYCPGAAMGADDMVANGHDVAVIEYHNGDAFATTISQARLNYYGISSFPTAKFDGVLEKSGGSSTSSMYSSYLPLYNQRIVIPCDFTAQIFGNNTSGSNYHLDLLLEEVNTYSGSDLVLQVAMTESEIACTWQGQSELNFVCRDMYPDDGGTALDFSTASQQVISFDITIDPTWATQHCELVIFVQDNTTKEVLQGSMVELDNLIPLAASAAFTSNTVVTCEGSTVDYTDNSLGMITSWNWTFEGGTPATSTDENPTVSYANEGVYDVILVVDDGSTTSTLDNTDYLTVEAIPLQADMPTGSENPCQNGSAQYTTNPVTYADEYEWKVQPTDAGTMSGTGTTGTLNLSQTFVGDITISVKAINDCGDGAWSTTFAANVKPTPIIFNLSDGGGYCEGEPGIELSLDNSEAGVDYELYLDDVTTGNVMAGTGSSINFGFQTDEGIYTAYGYTTYCDMQMAGNSWVHPLALPGTASTPTGPTADCNNMDSTLYETSGASSASTYAWTLEPAEAGLINGVGKEAWIDWKNDFSGQVNITVQGSNDCGTGNVSSALEVTVNATPTPEISGEQLVCENWEGIVYKTDNTSDHIYTWEIDGGTIASGAGTNEVSVDWGTAGQAWLKVTEESAEGCIQATENYLVTIDDCMGINELNQANTKVYPNPANDQLFIELASAISTDLNIKIMDLMGKVVAQYNKTANNGVININISQLNNGVYAIEISGAETGKITQKLVKN
jgi:PKD repeat protein